MSAIAFDIPEDILAMRGLRAFAEAEILLRHEANLDLFEDQRRLYDSDGRFSEELLDLIGEVRRAASKAGYYQMCVPEELGGGGDGAPRLFRRFRRAVSHLRPTKLVDALCGEPLGVRAKPIARKTYRARPRRDAGADDGGRKVDLLWPIGTRSRVRRIAHFDTRSTG